MSKRAIVIPVYDHTSDEEIREMSDALRGIGIEDFALIGPNTAAFMHLTDPSYTRGVVERDHAASAARIVSIADAAEQNARKFAERFGDASDRENQRYYTGMRDGLNRALSVLNGKG